MIISHKYKFIFIKTRKTAGTSIEVFLSNVCGPNDIVTPIYPPEDGHLQRNYNALFNPFREINSNRYNLNESILTLKELIKRRKFYNHMSAEKVRNRIDKKIWNSYYKFTVERNPWDKTVSFYNMINKRENLNLSFSEFLKLERMPVDCNLYTDYHKQNIIVNDILRYENLNEELKRVFKRLGINFSKLDVYAKSNSKSKNRSYQDYYTDVDIQKVAKSFKFEINTLNYNF